jgi:hypothetical protein
MIKQACDCVTRVKARDQSRYVKNYQLYKGIRGGGYLSLYILNLKYEVRIPRVKSRSERGGIWGGGWRASNTLKLFASP